MKNFKKLFYVFLVITMIATFFYIIEKTTVKAATLNNPRKDSNGNVTWDCVWFGSYPQAEVVPSGKYTEVDSLILKEGDIIISSSIYNKLKSATGWDANGDITLNGVKYRRIKKGDATYGTSGNGEYYNWSDSTIYHYFKYEPIRWRVLNVNGNDAFLLADKALDAQNYNLSLNSVTWEKSTIRSWLNGYGALSNTYGADYSSKNFIDTAFLDIEQTIIKTTLVINDDNIAYGTECGNNSNDKIFLLSESEVYTNSAKSYGFASKYDIYDEARRSKSSTYAKAMGTWSNTDTDYAGNCRWWLRSSGLNAKSAADVGSSGFADGFGFGVQTSDKAVRPAFHINLSSPNLYSYAGTVCSDGSVNESKPGETTKNDNISNDYLVGKKKQIISAVSRKVSKGTKPFYLNAKTDGDGKLTYKSSNSKVAKISSTGKLEVKEYGTATITIKASETAMHSEAVKKIKIIVVPKKMSLKKVFSSGRTGLSVLWKKNNKITGYEIYFSARKDFKRETYKRLFKKSKSRMDVVGLKSRKKYYVKIRCYKVMGKKKYYSAWSKVRKVKVR